ncbi:MAG: hypothetical protein ACRD4F_05540 [Candidatus Angelobacter sp.]
MILSSHKRRVATICSGWAAAIAGLALLIENVQTSNVTHAAEGFVAGLLLVLSTAAFIKSRSST